jgi:hypothetical protein
LNTEQVTRVSDMGETQCRIYSADDLSVSYPQLMHRGAVSFDRGSFLFSSQVFCTPMKTSLALASKHKDRVIEGLRHHHNFAGDTAYSV